MVIRGRRPSAEKVFSVVQPKDRAVEGGGRGSGGSGVLEVAHCFIVHARPVGRCWAPFAQPGSQAARRPLPPGFGRARPGRPAGRTSTARSTDTAHPALRRGPAASSAAPPRGNVGFQGPGGAGGGAGSALGGQRPGRRRTPASRSRPPGGRPRDVVKRATAGPPGISPGFPRTPSRTGPRRRKGIAGSGWAGRLFGGCFGWSSRQGTPGLVVRRAGSNPGLLPLIGRPTSWENPKHTERLIQYKGRVVPMANDERRTYGDRLPAPGAGAPLDIAAQQRWGRCSSWVREIAARPQARSPGTSAKGGCPTSGRQSSPSGALRGR